MLTGFIGLAFNSGLRFHGNSLELPAGVVSTCKFYHVPGTDIGLAVFYN